MKKNIHLLLFLLVTMVSVEAFPQSIIEEYAPQQNDSLRIGTGDTDFLPFVKSGYTLMLPEGDTIKGVLIFLEDSQYDDKNRSAKQMYEPAAANGFAVLSVSTEIPLDFYFSKSSMLKAHGLIQTVFSKHHLPNQNIFFLGTSLVGHRAMRYLQFLKEADLEFIPNVKGMVLCNFTMDFTRKWYQHERDIRIGRINLWEPKFINFMLETYLGGTPKTNPEAYFNFSPYSYTDEKNRNIEAYKEYAVRVYIEPAIKYKLTNQLRTLYENNATDMVGFLAELELAGNKNTELIVLQPEDNPATNKNTQATWDALDKEELMNWVIDVLMNERD